MSKAGAVYLMTAFMENSLELQAEQRSGIWFPAKTLLFPKWERSKNLCWGLGHPSKSFSFRIKMGLGDLWAARFWLGFLKAGENIQWWMLWHCKNVFEIETKAGREGKKRGRVREEGRAREGGSGGGEVAAASPVSQQNSLWCLIVRSLITCIGFFHEPF